jgi:intracellular septation protein A
MGLCAARYICVLNEVRLNKHTLGPLVLFFIFAGAGSQVDYLPFGWIFFVVSVLLLIGVGWLNHQSVKASLVELIIVVISGVVSIAIGKTLAGGVVSLAVGISLKILALCVIALLAWLIVPASMRKNWDIF